MQKQVKEIPAEAMNALSAHSWPGNIRELQNFIERSVILTTGRTLCPRLEGLRQTTKDELPEATTLEDAERNHIRKTLKQTKGVVAGSNGAARYVAPGANSSSSNAVPGVRHARS